MVKGRLQSRDSIWRLAPDIAHVFEPDRQELGARVARAFRDENDGNWAARESAIVTTARRRVTQTAPSPLWVVSRTAMSSARRRDLLGPLLVAQEGHCWYCWRLIALDEAPGVRKATLEHLQPKSQGGTHRRNNLQAVCARCNQRSGIGPRPKRGQWAPAELRDEAAAWRRSAAVDLIRSGQSSFVSRVSQDRTVHDIETGDQIVRGTYDRRRGGTFTVMSARPRPKEQMEASG